MRRRLERRDPETASTMLAQSDVGRLDPPRVHDTRPMKRYQEKRQDLEAMQTAVLSALTQTALSIGGLLDLMRANAPGDAIGTGSQIIKAAGVNERLFPAGFQSVAITNFSGSPMVVAAAPAASQAPLIGPMVYVVPAGCYRVVPLRGAVVSVYGVVGANYDLTTYSKPRPMDFASIGSLAGGNPAVVAVGNPAAGANFNAAPAAGPFTIVGIGYTLTTSATVANRTAGVQVGGIVAAVNAPQAASLAVAYSFFPGAAETATTAPIPGGPFAAGTAIASLVANLQAGDQISAITLDVAYNIPAATPV